MTTSDVSSPLSGDPSGESRVEGGDAQSTTIRACRALAETVRTTLGPKGLDKMLVGSDGRVVVTNDGASILDRMDISHPTARLLVDAASQQEDRAGDGTTTAVVLAGELLTVAEDLLEQGVHPTTIIDGYQRAAGRAVETLERDAISVDTDDTDRLREVARTAITGKWDAAATAFLADAVVETVQAIAREQSVDFDRITRKTAPGGSVFDSEVVDGLIIDMERSSTDVVSPEPGPPRYIEDATVALIDDQLTIETATGQGAVTVESPEGLERFREYEDDVYSTQVRHLVDAGVDVVFCQKSIDDSVRYRLARENVLAVERTRQDELHKLARATGARYVMSTDELTPAHTGQAGVVERRTVGAGEFTVVRDAAEFEQASLLLRGGTEHVVEELKRIVDDCFHVLKLVIEDGRVLPGGGATELALARALRSYAGAIPHREQLAVEAFADATETVPRTLATTAGLDPVDTLIELRARHHAGDRRAGLAVETGTVENMVEEGIVDPFSVKRRAVLGAAEAATLLLRVDGVVSTSAEQADQHEEEADHGAGGLVQSTEGYPWAVGHSMGHDH